MVRSYVRKTSGGSTPADVIRKAFACVTANGISIRMVAEQFGIANSTLRRHLVITPDQERVLVGYLMDAANIYFGLSPKDVGVLAFECASAFNIDMPESLKVNKQAGADWFTNFMKRNHSLSIRILEATSLSKTSSFKRMFKIICSCCNFKFSCACSLHVHFTKDKNVLRYLIDTRSCKAEILAENYSGSSEANTEIAGKRDSLNKRDDGDKPVVAANVAHVDFCNKSVSTATGETIVVNTEASTHCDSYTDQFDDENRQTGHVDIADKRISEDNLWSASLEGQYNEDFKEEDKHTAKKKNDTDGLKRGQLLSSNVEAPCDICGHVFKRRNLKRHLQSHATTKEFTCEICQKIFRTESSLHCHRLHHRTEKDLICHFCGKQFNNGPNLRQHIKTHTRNRSLKCPLCPKMFRSNYVLKDHISRHSGEKPYACTVCNRSFRKPQEVKRHMTCHSEARDHMCRICDKRFKSKSNRLKHEKIHDRKKKTESKV